jgi:hypothetical protein
MYFGVAECDDIRQLCHISGGVMAIINLGTYFGRLEGLNDMVIASLPIFSLEVFPDAL